jgi:hypothetical protein
MGRFHRIHDQPRSQYIWPRENAVEEVEPDLEEGLEGSEMGHIERNIVTSGQGPSLPSFPS